MSTLRTVQDLKESLSKQLVKISGDPNDSSSSSVVLDMLERLNELEITMDILSDTLIGTVVSKFKSQTNHPQVAATAKQLVKKWKKIAKSSNSAETPASASTASTTSTVSSKKAPPSLERRESVSSVGGTAGDEDDWSYLPEYRQNICQKMHSLLLTVKTDLLKSGVNVNAITTLTISRAGEVEDAISNNFGKDKKSYIDKARSLAFNLKKNKSLCQDVVLGSVSANDLVLMSSEELLDSQTRRAREDAAKKLIDSKRLDWEQANEDKINEMCGIKGDLLKASLFTCGRCKSTKTTSTQKQTRSADEPMTVFVLCMNCGKRWKC